MATMTSGTLAWGNALHIVANIQPSAAQPGCSQQGTAVTRKHGETRSNNTGTKN
jgi:hypothetical protein